MYKYTRNLNLNVLRKLFSGTHSGASQLPRRAVDYKLTVALMSNFSEADNRGSCTILNVKTNKKTDVLISKNTKEL